MKTYLLNTFLIVYLLSIRCSSPNNFNTIVGTHNTIKDNAEYLKSKGQYFNLSEFDRWQNFWNLNQVYFEPKAGQLRETAVTWNPMEDFVFDSLYTQFFIFSPDSNYFLDLDSYNLALDQKDGELISTGFEVDTEMVLYDLKNKSYRSIFYCGTPCLVESAYWINETEFCLLGFEEMYKEKNSKIVWKPRALQFHVNSDQQMGDYFKTVRDISQKS
jgi:hypothetical protein